MTMNRQKQPKRFSPALRTFLMTACALTILLGLSGAANAQSQWTTNGSNITNTNSGNVGIGTTNPQYGKLQVNKLIRIDDDSGSVNGSDALLGAAGLYIGTSGGGSYFQFNAGGGLDLWQYNAGWLRTVTFTKTGNVGIGTNAPGYRLDVQTGQINASGGLCIAGDCKTSWSQVGGGGSQWPTSGSNIYYNSGNIGIGASSPNSAKLVISGVAGAEGLDLSTTDQYANLRVIRNSNSSFDKDLFLQYGAGAGSKIHFYSNNSESMTLTGGNVGIGLNTPASRLTVVGDGSGVAQIGSAGCGSNYVALTLSLTAAPSGCSNYTFASSPTDQTLYINRPSGKSIRFRENNDYSPDQLVIASGGNVGIGTTTPTARLDVEGDIKVSGNINAKYQDVAEWVGSSRAIPAGTVVVIDSQKPNQVVPSSESYDSRVAGVISARPGITLGEAGADKVLVATTGRVKVKVDATRSPIRIGDLLVT